MRVQLPLGAFSFAWTVRRDNEGRSAVNDFQRVGKHGNPRASGARERRFKSDHADWKTLLWSPCWYGQATVNLHDTGSIPVAAARRREVIRLDEEPASKAGVPMNRDCGFESHGFRLEELQVPLADRLRRQPSKRDRRVRLPQGTFDWVGSSVAEQVLVKHPRVGSSPTLPSFIAG